jgi:hypothetical protein
MLRKRLEEAVGHVGQALREPEMFAFRWHWREARYGAEVWIALISMSFIGTAAYGMTMGILKGPSRVLVDGFELTVAAGLAWAIPLPALYILNSLTGSKLSASETLLAAAVTTSWGALAMVASIPINWFFTVAVPVAWFVQLVNVVVFTGVGVAMIDIFGRIVRTLEPERGRAPAWFLGLVAMIGTELFHAFRLFDFSAGK